MSGTGGKRVFPEPGKGKTMKKRTAGARPEDLLSPAGRNVPVDAGRFAGQRDVALYISDVTLQLRNLAHNANLDFLAYLLEMAFREAFDLADGGEAGDGPGAGMRPPAGGGRGANPRGGEG